MPHTPTTTAARRAPVLCSLTAAVLIALGSPTNASELTVWQRIKADPRMAHRDTLSLTEKRALARDYGFENLLPKTNAATVLVSNCNDAGPGSLRDAVTSAVSGNTVDASALTCGTITLTTGALSTIAQDLTINGPGPDALTITANHASRIVTHAGTGVLALYGMTLREGRFSSYGTAPARGGCVFSTGTVDLGSIISRTREQGVVVEDCEVQAHADGVNAFGGGVAAIRGLGLFASVVSGNVASSAPSGFATGGGLALLSGLYQFPNGNFLAKYSEIRGNVAGWNGGGVYARAYRAGVFDSTIAGNLAGGSIGGALFSLTNDGGTYLQNATVSDNRSATSHGGMAAFGGTIQVLNSTITGNQTDASPATDAVGGADFYGRTIDLESSIFSANLAAGVPHDVRTLAAFDNVTGANNLVGVAVGIVPPTGLITTNNPGLGALVNNGGLTRTHAVLAGSPAIDAGNNNDGIPFDQRAAGFARVVGAAADIGAFERNPDVVLLTGFD